MQEKYELVISKTFKRSFKKLSEEDRIRVKNAIKELVKSPIVVKG